jgi:hypothetical protein
MPIIIEAIPNDMILLITVQGYLNLQAAEKAYHDAVQCCQEKLSQSRYVIDVSEATTSFTDLIRIIKQAASYSESSNYRFPVVVVLVGKSHWTQLFSDLMRHIQFGGINIPIFETTAAAVAYIQEQAART